MTSTRLKDSSSPFSLLRLGDTDLILSCTASLLPTLPLRAPLQARLSSLLHLPLARALLARQDWPPPFLNVRIKVWQKNSPAVLPSSCLPPHPHPYPSLLPAHVSQDPGLRAGPANFPRRARSRSPAARRDRLPASPRDERSVTRGGGTSPPRALSFSPTPGRAGGRINVHSINPAPRSRRLPRHSARCVCVGVSEDMRAGASVSVRCL